MDNEGGGAEGERARRHADLTRRLGGARGGRKQWTPWSCVLEAKVEVFLRGFAQRTTNHSEGSEPAVNGARHEAQGSHGNATYIRAQTPLYPRRKTLA